MTRGGRVRAVSRVLSPRRVILAGEAAVALTAAHLAVRLLGSPRLMRLLGRLHAAGEAAPAGSDGPVASDAWRPAKRVARAVDRVADALPWRPVCLPRAMATRTMLRRRGVPCEMHLGIATTSPLSAHAWVTAGGRVVMGGPVTHITALATLR